MRTTLYLVIFFDIFIKANLVSQSLNWGERISGPGHKSLQDIATDTSGNVYSVGWFTSTADFDPSDSAYNLTSAATGNYDWHGGDIFVTKWDSEGNFIWAKQFAGTTYENQGLKIAIDASGSVYTTGYFTKSVDFDPGPATYNLNAGNGRCIFLSKLDSNGNFVWANQFGDTVAWAWGDGLEIDNAGNIVIRGRFGGNVDFDPSSNHDTLNSSSGYTFLCKYKTNGDLIWSKQFKLQNAPGDSQYTSVAIDAIDQIYITGTFTGTLDIDPGPGTYIIQSATGEYLENFDACVLKLNSDGDFIWARTFFGGSQAYDIAVDIYGNIYTSGHYQDTCDFDPGPGTFTLATSASLDTYLAKLSPSGNLLWVHDFNAEYIAYGMALTTDVGGNIYIAGYFGGGTIDCDPSSSIYTLSAGPATGFVCCWNKSGNLVWAGQQTTPTISWDWALHVDKKNNVYFGGEFWDAADVDPFSTVVQFQTQSSDGFICKAKTCDLPSPLTGSAKGPQNICEGDAIIVTYTTNTNVVWFISGIAIGSGTSCLTPGLTSANNTIYVRAENSCGVNPKAIQLVINLSPCVSLAEFGSDKSLRIYPNPSESLCVLEIPENYIGQEFIIINMSGQIVFQGTLRSKSNMLDLPLTKGMYLLRTSGGQFLRFDRS